MLFNGLGALLLGSLFFSDPYFAKDGYGIENLMRVINALVSYVTNTNWQNFPGAFVLAPSTQYFGIIIENFFSASTGLSVAFVLIRALMPTSRATSNNFWVDTGRINCYLLLPLALLFSTLLMALGVPDGATLEPEGFFPVASTTVIKLLGTNGGGFFAANSAHPLENPSDLTNIISVFLMLLIPAALPLTFGLLAKRPQLGHSIFIVMLVLFSLSVMAFAFLQKLAITPETIALPIHGTTLWEGMELRLGLFGTALFNVAATASSSGATNAVLSSLHPLAVMVLMLLMGLGEVVFGGIGSGFYSMMFYVLISVFLASLLIGKTPIFLAKPLTPSVMRIVMICLLSGPMLVLIGTTLTVALSEPVSINEGAARFTEIFYAWLSAVNNNGSSMNALEVNTLFWNGALSIAMILGRYIPIVCVFWLIHEWTKEKGTLKREKMFDLEGKLFILFLLGVIVILGVLTFLPALVLGPIVSAIAL